MKRTRTTAVNSVNSKDGAPPPRYGSALTMKLFVADQSMLSSVSFADAL